MKEKQNNINNTQQRTILRRHTTKRHTMNANKVYEIQIKHLTQKLRRNITQIPKLDLKQEQLTINNYITCLQIPPEQRTTEHVGVIHYYLNRTNIIDKFNNDGIDPINHSQMLITTSTHAKYTHINANEMIYDYFTTANFTYVVVSGKVVLHYPTPMKAALTGYEYYTYIIDLLHNNDISSLQALSEHYNNGSINSEYYFSYGDVHLLKHIALKLHFDKQSSSCSNGDNVDVLRALFEVIKLNPSDIGINSDDDDANTVIEKINACIDNITYDQYNKYSYILNTTTKHEVTLYTFKPTKTLHEGDYFGECIHNTNNAKYNCKCYTSDDTQLCVISNYIYNTYLHIDKNNSMLKEINFLYDKYFFRKIVKRKFEREYFKLFTKRIYKKHQTIITEDFLLQHIYFIQDGTIELSSNKSVVETHHSIKQLTRGSSFNNSNNTEIYNSFFSNIRSKPLHMLSQLTDKASKTIVVTSSNEVLGVDSMLNKINHYLYTAKVVSNYATVYALSVDDLMFILEHEGNDVARDFERTAVMKGDLLKERFVNVNTSALGVVDRAIANENYYKGHKIDLMNYNEVSYKHKHVNKAALTKHFNTHNVTDVLSHCDSNISNSNSNSNIHSLQYKTIESSASMIDKVNRGLSSNKCILPSISVKKTSLNKLDKYKTLSIKSFEDRIYHKVQKQHKLIQQSLISYSQKEESTTLNNNNNTGEQSGTLTQPSEKELLNVTNAFITALPPSSDKIEIKDDIHLLSETSSHKKLNTINLHLKKPYRSPFVKYKLQKYSIFDSNNINYSLKPTEAYSHKQYRMYSSYGTKIGSGIKDLIEKDINTFTTCNSGLNMPTRDINSSSIFKLKGNSPKHTVNSTYKKHILKKINELYYI